MRLELYSHVPLKLSLSVANPGFPRVEAPTLQGAPTYDFAKFPKSYMELKEFGPEEGERPPP